MRIGYARVSTDEQDLALQREALSVAGCEVIFEDHGASGADAARPGLEEALAKAEAGDVLVVWRLDRLGRSLGHLIEIIDDLGHADIGFVSLFESLDGTSASGRLMFHVFGALAEFERALISERTKAGMAAARRQGRHLGRPRLLSEEQIRHARREIASGRHTFSSMARILGVSAPTVVRALKRGRSP